MVKVCTAKHFILARGFYLTNIRPLNLFLHIFTTDKLKIVFYWQKGIFKKATKKTKQWPKINTNIHKNAKKIHDKKANKVVIHLIYWLYKAINIYIFYITYCINIKDLLKQK